MRNTLSGMQPPPWPQSCASTTDPVRAEHRLTSLEIHQVLLTRRVESIESSTKAMHDAAWVFLRGLVALLASAVFYQLFHGGDIWAPLRTKLGL